MIKKQKQKLGLQWLWSHRRLEWLESHPLCVSCRSLAKTNTWKQEKISPSKKFCCLEVDVVHTDINRSALSITFGSCLINVNRSQFLMKCLHNLPMTACSRSRSEIAEDLPPQGPSFQRLHGESDFYLLKLPHHSVKHNRYFERGLGAVDTETDFFETALFQRRSQRKKKRVYTNPYSKQFPFTQIRRKRLKTVWYLSQAWCGATSFLPYGGRRRRTPEAGHA